MESLDNLSDGQTALNVRHPVQVKAKEPRLLGGNKPLHIEPWPFEHLEGNIDDPNTKTMPFQVLGHAHETNRIELKNRRGGHHVTDRTVHHRGLSEVVETGRMEQDKIKP